MKLAVTVVLALPGRQELVELELAEGSTVAHAVTAARLAERFPELDIDRLATGIWSRPRPADTRLRDGDRVELYRPLQADVKDERRSRARLRPPTGGGRRGR